MTSFLPRTRSTTELCGPDLISVNRTGAGGRIRTYVAVRRQIYSLVVLATHPPLQQSIILTCSPTSPAIQTRERNPSRYVRAAGRPPPPRRDGLHSPEAKKQRPGMHHIICRASRSRPEPPGEIRTPDPIFTERCGTSWRIAEKRPLCNPLISHLSPTKHDAACWRPAGRGGRPEHRPANPAYHPYAAHLPIPYLVGAPPAPGWLLPGVGRPPDFAHHARRTEARASEESP